ncbi:MAG TPA: AAA family ATPase [Steroidobacteraceae bacterium]|nr:AAA family ATPase [Steroidobacteraceae bacterium]
MKIVIIGGLPCSGKTKLANAFRARCKRPLLCKDEIKERLFDSVGVGGRDWSRRLSVATYEIMFAQAFELANCGLVFAMEGNFREGAHRERFAGLAALGATFVQAHCRADANLLIERFRQRALSGQRHAGHVDAASLPEIELELRTQRQLPLNLPGVVIECDTTRDWEATIERAVREIEVEISTSDSDA